MNIFHSSVNSANSVFELIKNSNQNLEEEKIFQWTDSYPTIEIIERDIFNRELFELNIQEQIVGVICPNNKQEEIYNTIDWKDNGTPLIIHPLAIDSPFQRQRISYKIIILCKGTRVNSSLYFHPF